MFTIALAGIGVAAWLYLLAARGRFWADTSRADGNIQPQPERWPTVAAVIPARNEAEVISDSLASLLRQDYAGTFGIVVVDDDSNDGTAAVAGRTAETHPDRAVTIVASQAVPPGWTGKMWALKQGIATAECRYRPDYLLLTDADIVHAPDSLAWLTAQAASGNYVLTSLMAKLNCESLAERSHVPAFIYFFQMLFPFAWVRKPKRATAAAAGGCMLVRVDALRDAGGIEAIRHALIDDCALAKKLKERGPIWLGLTERVRSIRRYDSFADVRHMVVRSAYAQLNFSPWLLAATVLGLALTFMTPPLLALFAHGVPRLLGVATWLAMALSFQPTLRDYRLSPLWGLALPAIAFLYALYTLDSAYQHARKRGGQWKGRVYAGAPSLP
ncbi:MAG TPA: glycosyltransferase [Pseudolabrys sp.]|nr:glycosyltransferase [Pseudolabrys sp.]